MSKSGDTGLLFKLQTNKNKIVMEKIIISLAVITVVSFVLIFLSSVANCYHTIGAVGTLLTEIAAVIFTAASIFLVICMGYECVKDDIK